MRAALTILCLTLATALAANAANAASWPLCSIRSGTTGGPAIIVDGTVHSPIMFIGNNQFDRDDVLIRQMRLACDSGIKLLGFGIPMDWEGDPAPTDAVIDKFCTAVPDGYFYLRVWMGAPETWCAQHPDDCIVHQTQTSEGVVSYVRKSNASLASEPWRKTARERLTAIIRHIVQGPHGKRFLGICPTYLQTGEWFNFEANEFMDYSPASLAGFRRWLKEQYRTNEKLRAAWGRTDLSFDTAELPGPGTRDEAILGPFRDPIKHRAAEDFQRYQSELAADTIAMFAKAAKEASEGRSLVGAFYGYTMELSNNGPRALANSGHMALAKLLECPDLDLIHAPVSYFERGLGQPSHLHLPVDSIALHGKLAILEEDTFTHLVTNPPSDPTIPGWNERTKSLEETLAVTRRHFGTAFTHGAGIWFFDLLSDGRWDDIGFWQASPLFRRAAAELREQPPFQPEIAVAVSETAVATMKATTYPVLLQSLSFWRAEIDRIGSPVGYYLQGDLPRLPKTVKVLILPDAFSVTKEEQSAIAEVTRRGGTVIWNYAPGIRNEKGLDVANIQTLTGIAVEAKFDTTPMSIVSAFNGELSELDPNSWQPRFVITAKDVDVVARYKDTNEVSAAARKTGDGVSVYTATPRLPAATLREVCARAGVHLYKDTPGMIGVVGSYIFLHTEAAGKISLQWPRALQSVERVVPKRGHAVVLEEHKAWSDELPANTTAVYCCEPLEKSGTTNLRIR